MLPGSRSASEEGPRSEEPDFTKKKKAIAAGTLVVLAVSLIAGWYVFNYFCGCFFNDPIEVSVDTADKLSWPPIILYPLGDPPSNVTYTVTTGTLSNGAPVSVYQYWFFWPGCALAPNSPLCLAGHQANDWEPLYIFWSPTLTSGVLLNVYWRYHFYFWKNTPGSQTTLNGTQIIVTFSKTYHTPTVDTTPLSAFFKPSNVSLSIPVQTPASLPGLSSVWTYYVSNGGPHSLPIFLDPGSPPANGPNAYENSANGYAGPSDPFSPNFGTTHNYQIGLAAGSFAAGVIASLGLLVEVDIHGFQKILRRRR